MPWQMLPIPILIGMLAHTFRWEAILVTGASVEIGALAACLVAGFIALPSRSPYICRKDVVGHAQ
jgi:uncharacterized membrane protein YjjB (DUF3815 family)